MKAALAQLYVYDKVLTAVFLGARLVHGLGAMKREAISVSTHSYGDHPQQTLDVYRPDHAKGPLPVVVYVHGGAFATLSKDTHWMMALPFVRAGCLVVSINYRMAPAARYPAALEDTCDAIGWVLDRVAALGGDPKSVALAGESAGANLVVGATLASCYARPEAFAQKLYDRAFMPKAVLAACGTYDLSNLERFQAGPRWITAIMQKVNDLYTGDEMGVNAELAHPLLFMETGALPERPLPPFFLPSGSADPLNDDTARLAAVLRQMNADVEAPSYDRGIHNFHMLWGTQLAVQCWRDKVKFLQARLA